MPTSKKRTKRPSALSGIPARVVALSPADWAPEQRAAWCRHYLDGAAGRPLREERRAPGRGFSPSWPRMAHRRGEQDADIARADVAQTDQRRRELAVAREAMEDRRERETGSRRNDLLQRLSGLGGGLSPHDDPRIVGAALGALGLSLESLGMPLRRVSKD